jgi:hypothetical protein
MIEFQRFVIGLHRRNKYSSSQIGNADENIGFSNMPCNYTINIKREKQVAVKTTGYEKLCVTVMLCITINDTKLPPYVIPIKHKDSFSKDVIVWAQKKCMNDI